MLEIYKTWRRNHKSREINFIQNIDIFVFTCKSCRWLPGAQFQRCNLVKNKSTCATWYSGFFFSEGRTRNAPLSGPNGSITFLLFFWRRGRGIFFDDCVIRECGPLRTFCADMMKVVLIHLFLSLITGYWILLCNTLTLDVYNFIWIICRFCYAIWFSSCHSDQDRISSCTLSIVSEHGTRGD